MKNKWWILIFVFLSVGFLHSADQDYMNFRGEMNSWTTTGMSYNSDLDVWSVTILSDGDDIAVLNVNNGSNFKFDDEIDWGDYSWGTGGTVPVNTSTLIYNTGNDGYFDEYNGFYYHFSILDVPSGDNSYTVIQKLSSSPNTISSITEPTTVYQDQTQTITATLLSSQITEEKVYICFTTDNWVTRSDSLASGTGFTSSAIIPMQKIGTTVKFYAMTTTSDKSSWDDKESLHTLDHEYSKDSPYSYTVSDHNNQTPHTISIDGQNDFSDANEWTAASGTDNYWWYTWDADNFYFAISQGAIDEPSPDKWVVLYIDTDPRIEETTGTGTTTGLTYRTQQPSLPFSANYHFRWSTDQLNFDLYEFTSSWEDKTDEMTMPMAAYQNGDFFELKIDEIAKTIGHHNV